jgi:murein DD-endopeptidase MepM/ murein hydrolase activator NlpD
MLLCGCASAPSGPRDTAAIEARVAAVLERRGPASGSLTQIGEILASRTPSPQTPPLVLELLDQPLRSADAAAIFSRSVPERLARFVETVPATGGGSALDIRALLEPYLKELAEAQRALRAASRGAPVDPAPVIDALRTDVLGSGPVRGLLLALDAAELQRAQDLFLDATLRMAAAVRASSGRIRFPEGAERFESAVGIVQIGSSVYDEHGPEAAVIVDPGGDDLYRRAPATGGAVSVIIDLAGDDLYLGPDIAVHGLSAIVDFAGDDRYRMEGPGLGAAVAGASLLLDFGGDDRYEAELYGIGAGMLGLGALVDFAGNDRYRVRALGQGYSSTGGIGLLWDLAGDDAYIAAAGIPDTGWERGGGISLAQGSAFGLRPNYGGGIGILRDDAGDDRYEAEMFAQGVAYWYGTGLLWDRAGNDRYHAIRYAQGSGVHLATGTLRDESGDDRYSLTVGVGQGMGLDLAVGLLYDGAGNDRYTAPNLAQGSATDNGIGILVDNGGRDAFKLGGLGWNVAEPSPARGGPSVGILIFDAATAGFER